MKTNPSDLLERLAQLRNAEPEKLVASVRANLDDLLECVSLAAAYLEIEWQKDMIPSPWVAKRAAEIRKENGAQTQEERR